MRAVATKPELRLALLSLALGISGVCNAQFSFPNFAGRQNELMFFHQAAIVGSLLRLNPGGTYTWGAAYYHQPQPVLYGFEVNFTFRIWDLYGGGADGLAFVIARQPQQHGCCLGYHNIPHSIAVEFDTHQNSEDNDPNANHIAVNTAWEQPNCFSHTRCSLATVIPPFALDSGEVIPVRIVYQNEVFQVYVRNLSTPLIQVSLSTESMARIADPNGRAHLGFTGGSGGWAEKHDILSWSFHPLCGADVDCNGCVDDADLLAVLFAFGQSGSGQSEDVNNDGIVDDADLLLVLFSFGGGC